MLQFLLMGYWACNPVLECRQHVYSSLVGSVIVLYVTGACSSTGTNFGKHVPSMKYMCVTPGDSACMKPHAADGVMLMQMTMHTQAARAHQERRHIAGLASLAARR